MSDLPHSKPWEHIGSGKSTKVEATPVERLDTQLHAPACLVCIHPPGKNMALRYTLADLSLILGRDPACEIPIDSRFVSRDHARLQPCVRGHEVHDLKSTNGTFVNDERVEVRLLRDGDYLRFGDCIFRYLNGSNPEAQYHEEIHRLTIIDALTGIHNKSYFIETLEAELTRAARIDHPLSLLLLDIDHFKSVNDTLGHLAGDHTLREMTARIKGRLRQADIFARYGGEEFAIVLPETSREAAFNYAEGIRDLVAKQTILYNSKPFSITISIGLADTESDKNLTTTELIHRADEKLYQAKHEGRNRVVG